MKKQFKIYLAVIACGLFFASTLFGQNPMIAVQISKLKMAKIEQFTAAHKKGNEILKKSSKTPVPYNAFTTDDNRLVLVAPIKSFADLDKMSVDIAANSKLIGNELNQQMSAAIASQETAILTLRNDLSLLPAQGTDFTDKSFVRWTHYYYHPKDGGKVMAMAKKLKEYWAKQEDRVPYFLYQPVFGSELNRVVVAHRVKDLAAIAELNATAAAHQKNPELISMNKEVVSIITDIKVEYGWYRADLSMSPE